MHDSTTPSSNASSRREDPGALVSAALAHHRAGRLAQAKRGYEEVLATHPDHADSLHLLGVVAHQSGHFQVAVDLIERAIRVDDGNPHFHNNLGEACRALGRTHDAVGHCERALALDPGNVDASCNLGNALLDLGRTHEAIAAYRRALSLDPRLGEAHYNLGNALRTQGDLEGALESLTRAAELAPRMPEVHGNLGGVLRALGRSGEAAECFRRALELNPGFVEIYASLGLSLVDEGRYDDALAAYDNGLRLSRAPGAAASTSQDTFRRTTSAKLRHDIDQMTYLMRHALLPEDFEQTVAAYREALTELEPQFAKHFIADIPPALSAKLAPTYNRLIHYGAAPALARPAIRATLDRAAVESDYYRNAPGITWIDDLLDQEALDALYRFCLDSTIWFKFDYENGYLAAVMGDGFLCPLLAQIAEELPKALPGIFRDHRLTQMWAFKYDAQTIGGVGMHADFAAVNVNFWVTPDDANLSPDSGGLIVWDKEAPLDWKFERFNNDQVAINEHLAQAKARALRVPYRCNRALVFNSDLFHRTDDIHFREGYENRRINITMLYGVRDKP